MDKFEKMRKEAITHLGILCGSNVQDSEQGVCDALHCVLERGTTRDVAKAIMIAGQWMWCMCEEMYHSEGGDN